MTLADGPPRSCGCVLGHYALANASGKRTGRSGTSIHSSANLFAAEHLLGAIRSRSDRALLFLLALMAGHPAFAAGLARLLTGPLVRGAFPARRFAALAGD